MHSKSFAAPIFLLALTSFVNANASSGPSAGLAVGPGLDVQSHPTESDVKQLSSANPCGNDVNIPQAIKTAPVVTPDANGDCIFSLSNFGATPRIISKVEVDSKGTGENFTPAKIIANGNGATSNGEQNITIRLPGGIKCSGGSSNLCLLSFTGSEGYGNCGVVSQPPTNTTEPNSAPPVTTPTPAPSPNHHGQAGDAPVVSSTSSPYPHGAVGEKGQQAGDANNKGKTSGNGKVNTPNNESTDIKGNKTTATNKGLKREPVQGMRLWGSR